MDFYEGGISPSPIEQEAIALKELEMSDVRVTNGPTLELPWSYWLSLAKAKQWMRMRGIKPYMERGHT